MRKKGGVFMLVHLPKKDGVTMIENTFIDQFMPAASGDFVKVYLYLLRCSQDGKTDVTIPKIADALNYTESDVRRAMGYWQRQNMLVMEDEEEDASSGLGTSFDTADHVSKTAAGPASDSAQSMPSDVARAGGKITEFRPSSKASKDDIRSLIFVAENYLARPLSQTEQRTLVYFMNDLGMDIDLIDYLLDYCISRNHTSFHYIEKVAQNWTAQGIRTAEQARREGSGVRKEYYDIFRALGIQDHSPTPSEIEFMDRWLGEYAFAMDIILLACRRTILQIGKAQFSYTDSILKSWHESGVKTVADVEALDRMHAETVRKSQAAANTAARPAGASRTPKAGSFVNFEHSGTDWDEIARQVMKIQDEEDSLSLKTQES